jgi:hypothetical protein
MALPESGVFEVRVNGHTDNPGGFDPGDASPGTDYSQQDAAQVIIDNSTVTGASVGAGASAILQLTGHTVTAADRANFVRFTGGTSVTQGIYKITAVDTVNNRWTLDRNFCTGATTNPTARMGGAVASIGRICNVAPGGSLIWIANDGVHLFSSTVAGAANSAIVFTTAAAGSNRALVIRGYDAVRGDTGTMPVLRANLNSQTIFNGAGSGSEIVLENLDFDGNSGSFTGTQGLGLAGDIGFIARDCVIRNCSIGVNGNAGITKIFLRCRFTGNATAITSQQVYCVECVFDANTATATIQATGVFKRCLFFGNMGGTAVITAGTGVTRHFLIVDQCVIDCAGQTLSAGNAGVLLNRAVDTAGTMLVYNTVMVNSNRYGFRGGSTAGVGNNKSNRVYLFNCAGYNNAGGDYDSIIENSGFIALSADPFTDSASRDYSLNDAAGGGALLKSAGWAWGGWAGAATPDSAAGADIGAWQSAGIGGGSDWPATGMRIPYQTAPV